MADNYTGNLNTWFVGGDEIDNAELTQQLLGTTDVLIFDGTPIASAVGEEMLIDELEIAGEALLAVL